MKTLTLINDHDDEIQGDWFNQQPESRDREEVPPLDQQRRLGLDIDMIGAREENLGSTKSQTLEMRSPSNQEMERASISMDNWIQETCYMSVVTSGPDEPNHLMKHGTIILQMTERKGEKLLLKNYTVWKIRKFGEPQENLMYQKAED